MIYQQFLLRTAGKTVCVMYQQVDVVNSYNFSTTLSIFYVLWFGVQLIGQSANKCFFLQWFGAGAKHFYGQKCIETYLIIGHS